MVLFDSHAHLADERVYPEADSVLQRAREQGIEKIVNVCTDAGSLERGLLLAKKHSQVYLAGAIPPHSVTEENESTFELFAEKARTGHFVAIGETGLDYFYHTSSKGLQIKAFTQYIHLALSCKLPLIIHCREAFDDFFDIIDAEYLQDGKPGPGVLHCFTGSQKDADKLVNRGWMVSFSGIVTFKKSTELQAIVKQVPMENLLIETDTPYLAPQSKRGKQNEPAFLSETARFIADLKGITFEELAKVTYQNALRFFSLEN